MKPIINFLSNPKILFYALPWLMTLLVLGTVAQRYIGLYQSQKLFFGSFILWVGLIPLPGAYTALTLIALCLIAKLLFKSPLKKQDAGIIITHLSTLILLIGGLVTAVSREEGYIVLGADETSHLVSDYHQRELAIIKNGETVKAIPHQDLQKDYSINDSSLPFTIVIEKFCYQCNVIPPATSSDLHGAASQIDIASAPLEKEDAENHSGAVFEVKGVNKDTDGAYITYQALKEQPEFKIGKDTYQIVMRPATRTLPFDLHLTHFEKSEYPGTNIARSYRSEVEVKDSALKWNMVIEMNQPLRYRGFTIYQSSFIENDDQLFTVLAVVKNAGDIFPYLAITALCLGLIIHIIITLVRKRNA